MFDMQALLLDPTYASWGVPAVITAKGGEVINCLVLDHRDGMNLVSARGSQSTLVPGTSKEKGIVFVRRSECRETPSGGTLVFEDENVVYSVISAQQKGNKTSGEWQLGLEEER